MKNLLGISLIALFAVSPMMANAAEGDRDAKLTKFGAGAIVLTPHLATTSYVDGAFKASADKIDLLIDDTAVATNGNYIDKGKSVSANMKELDAGLKNVNDVVIEHGEAIETLTGDGEGSVAQQIETALGGVSGNAGDLTKLNTTHKDSLVNAVNDVDSAAKDNSEAIQSINSKTISYVSDWSSPTVITKTIAELESED